MYCCLSAITFLMYVSGLQACTAIPNKQCACEYGTEYVDLSTDDIAIPLMASTNGTDDYYTFFMNPCGSLVEKSTGTNCEQSAICQRDEPHNGDPVQWYPAGLPTIEYSGEPNLDLKFKYHVEEYRDVHRSSTVDIVCKPDQGIEVLEYVSEHTNEDGVIEYYFTLKGDACCPKSYAEADDSLSTGSVLLIIFFVLVAVYFIGGSLFNKCVRGYTGVEMIPNYEFWCDVPKLVMDGWQYTISCGCCSTTTTTATESNAPAYDNI